METKFSLKDLLFNKEKIEKTSNEIFFVYPQFDKKKFTQHTLAKFPELELKERITWIAENLKQYLPDNYKKAVTMLFKSLPPPNDPTKTDNDFGDFIYAPYAEFVARYGCKKEYVQFSLNALREITMRFSAEDSIRYFINAFPDETMQELEKWSKDENYHVRRLASEGIRPKLPWSQKIIIPITKPLPILNNLFCDKTRYVTRSVANHINDISKIDPDLAIDTLDRWQKSEKQDPKEMDYIIRHALRALVKQGNKKAIEFLNFSSDPHVALTDFSIRNDPVKIGDSLEFSLTIVPQKNERLFIDYVIYFWSNKGHNNNKKVFKLKQLEVQKEKEIVLSKRHLLLANMTTRKMYPGRHDIEIQINGKKMGRREFEVV